MPDNTLIVTFEDRVLILRTQYDLLGGGMKEDSTGPFCVKDPQAVLPYGVDWRKWMLPGDAIVTSTWFVDPDGSLVMASPGFADGQTSIMLSGGLLGTIYQVTNRVTTQSGQLLDDRTFRLVIEQR